MGSGLSGGKNQKSIVFLLISHASTRSKVFKFQMRFMYCSIPVLIDHSPLFYCLMGMSLSLHLVRATRIGVQAMGKQTKDAEEDHPAIGAIKYTKTKSRNWKGKKWWIMKRDQLIMKMKSIENIIQDGIPQFNSILLRKSGPRFPKDSPRRPGSP